MTVEGPCVATRFPRRTGESPEESWLPMIGSPVVAAADVSVTSLPDHSGIIVLEPA